jgi:nucleoside-diphosphate-sugar epimerase
VFGDDFDTPDGTCLRDYLHITDLAKGHIKALEAVAEGKIFQPCTNGNYRPFNLGTGRAYSVLEMVKAMRAATGFDYEYTIAGRRLAFGGSSIHQSIGLDKFHLTGSETLQISRLILLWRTRTYLGKQNISWRTCALTCGDGSSII